MSFGWESVFYVLFSITMFKLIQEGEPDTDKVPTKSVRPAAVISA